MPLGAFKTALMGAAASTTPPYSAYFGGGLSGSTYWDLSLRVDFPTDTFSVVDATLGTGNRAGAGFSNNNTAGYQ